MIKYFQRAKRLNEAFKRQPNKLQPKSASIFKKVTSSARYTFNSGRLKANMEKDMGFRAARAMGPQINKFGGKSMRAVSKLGHFGSKVIRNKPVGLGLLAVGAVGMMSVSIMNGANNAAKDIILERYLQDQRFSRDILLQSRVGVSLGTNRMNRMGSTVGLSNALSRTRHGGY